MKEETPPSFLLELLEARSPSGHEFEAQAVIDKYVKPVADVYEKDVLGNRIARINPKGNPSVMFMGHMDELGLQITYIDDKGFLYFDTIGGHDLSIISGRRVHILTDKGVVKGVTGKRAVHLMDANDRTKVPQRHEIWIDIGAKTRLDAELRVHVGDVAVYDHGFEVLADDIVTGRAFDDKGGCYIVCEALRRLAKEKKLAASVIAVASTQEEIGTRGAATSAFAVQPDFAIAVDVSHATDHPDTDHRKFGKTVLGGGPIITRGPNINPFIFKRLVEVAEKNNIPYQLEAEPRPTGTDARAIQMAAKGVATGLISLPLRYMHTPSEIVSLTDAENCVKLLMAFAKSLTKKDSGVW